MNTINLQRLALMTLVTVSGWASTASATPYPGPDAFGYTGASTAYNFRDISGTGAQAFGGGFTDDAVTGAVGLGFGFSFYGSSYSNAYIGSNGFITFSAGQSQGCCSGGPLPGTTNPSNLVAGWFTDLTSGNPSSNIYYQTLGSAGSRDFIVQYQNNPYFNSAATNTFEIILHEGSNNIELQYEQTSANSHNRSVGIENAGGTIGLQLLNDNTSLLTRQGFCISSSDSSCSVQPNAVPEPGSLALFGLGMLLVTQLRRRAKR